MSRPGGNDDSQQPIADYVGRLLDDGKAYAQAEVRLVRARIEKSVGNYRRAVLLAAIAVGLGFATLIVLSISVVIALASLVGPLVGGLIATLLVGSAAAVVGLLAKNSFENVDEG